MKKIAVLLIAFLLGVLLAGCYSPSQVDENKIPAANRPQVWIDGPLEGMRLTQGSDYEIIAHGSDTSAIDLFEWTINGAPQLQALEAQKQAGLVTVRLPWSVAAAGENVIQVRARNLAGEWSTPVSITVWVDTASAPVVARATATPVALSLATAIPTLTPAPTWTLRPTEPPPPRLNRQYISPPVVYQYPDCPPNEITAAVKAFDPDGIDTVELLYRLRDPRNGDVSEWYSVAVNQVAGDEYVFLFTPAPNRHPLRDFVTPRIERRGADFQLDVQIQFVMRDKSGYSITSEVFSEVTLRACER